MARPLWSATNDSVRSNQALESTKLELSLLESSVPLLLQFWSNHGPLAESRIHRIGESLTPARARNVAEMVHL